jgi:hypothetical protein
MAKLTWLGEDSLHTTEDGSGAGPSFTKAFGGIKFPKDAAVEVTDKDIIARARKNQFFKVEGVPGRPPKVTDDDQNQG